MPPFMKNGHRDYTREKKWDHEHDGGKRLKDRAARNKARRIMEKEGLVHKHDGKHVDHIKALTSGGGKSRSNLRVVSAKTNLMKEARRK